MGDTERILRGAIGFSSYVAPPKNLWERFLKLVGRIIRYLSKSQFAHTFVWIWNDHALGPVVYEAADNGVTVNFADPEGYLDPQKYFVKVYMPLASATSIDAGLFSIRRYNGYMYGYLQLLGFAFVYIWLAITGRRVNNPIKGGIICSELVIIYLKNVFPHDEEIQKMDRNTTAPEDIYEFIWRNPDKFEEIPIPKPND
jgi:hypothetical protein